MQNKNKTVVKTKEILDLFQNNEQLSLQEMSILSGLSKTTVHRMLGSLEEIGLLTRTAEGKYELGFLFLQFGQLVKERLDIRKIALPTMKQLRDDVEEAVNLVIRDGNEAIYIEKFDTTQHVRVYTQIGRRAALYAGACPRILLTFMPLQQQQEYIEETPLIPYADGTITDKKKLQEVTAEARKLGYTISYSELRNFTSAVAAPIFNYDGHVVAGLSISGLESRFNEQRLPGLIEKTVAASKQISKNMGWTEL